MPQNSTPQNPKSQPKNYKLFTKIMDKTQVWDAVLARMAEKISRMEFGTWFGQVQLKEISGDAILIGCPTEMNKNWLENKYSSIILANLKKVLPEVEKVFFEVDLSLANSAPAKSGVFEKKSPRKLPNRPEIRLEPGIESRIVNPNLRLENFVVGEETRMAHAACRAVAECDLREEKKYNPLFVYGGVGLGKTHLLQGIANEILRRNRDALVVYTTAERMVNEIIKAIAKRDMESVRKKYRRVDALILDDVQFFENKERTQEELFNTFNDLHEFQKQIVFSADRPPSSLAGITDRLTSRMGWGLTVDVKMPGFETRVAIVQKKSAELGIMLPPDIIEFIAANCRKNLRELEQILNKISAEIDLTGASPTVQTVGKIFRTLHPDENLESVEGAQRGIVKSPDDIITAISEYFNIPATEILGNSRKKEIAFARQICWFLCKNILKMSYDAIGQDFGGKNHTTILHGIRKIEQLRRTDSPTARHLHALKKDLGVR